MKTAETARKKIELREKFLQYARAHALGDRIPTVAEFRKALGVTNYMLSGCMNELVKQGFLVRRSRREGTFLSAGPKKKVIGLILGNGAADEYINQPGWLAGVCSVFRGIDDFLLRSVQLSRLENLPDTIRRLGLDAVIVSPIGSLQPFDGFPPQVRSKIVFSLLNHGPSELPQWKENTIGMDHDFWPAEYVRAAVRKGCRRFLLFSEPDVICRTMIGEMEKLGMEWAPECLVSDPEKLKKQLPRLIRKYHPDAVRCQGLRHSVFAQIIKEIHGFRPLVPYYGPIERTRSLRKTYPWLNLFQPFEPLDDFFFRLGQETGKKAMELVRSGKPFPSLRLAMNYSPEYRRLIQKAKLQKGKEP